MTLLGTAACIVLLGLAGPAPGQTAPVIDQGKVASVTDDSVTIDLTVPAAEGAESKATVFYGTEDGGTQEGDWQQQADFGKKGESQAELQVVLEDLEAETPYVYRIRVTGPDGDSWSETATFRTLAWSLPWYLTLLIVLSLLIVPFVVGGQLAKRFRMPDHGWKIGLILCSLACGVAIVGFRWPPRLGIDLSGGTILVYEVDQDQKDPENPVDMKKLVAAVSERVNPGGVREMTVRPYGAEQIEIIIPKIDPEEARQIERTVGEIGTLEFRILANRVDNKLLLSRARAEEGNVLRDSEGNVEARWVPVRVGREKDFEDYLYRGSAGGGRVPIAVDDREVAIRETVRRGETILELLVVKDSLDVNGDYLEDASRDWDESGNLRVAFRFDSAGALLFGQLTKENLPDEVQEFYRKLGIILNGKLYSAPRIKSTIYDRGVIEMGTPSGEADRKEQEQDVDDLVRVLNAGSLPTALNKEPISRLVTGPTLGHDTIVKGSWAIGGSMVLVLLFMLFYYRFAGIVACGALLTNLVLILAIMIIFKAAFTLPGLAGLVLIVGMAVDANVLVFERIREEIGRGAALRMAIRNGFSRATTTIVDANVTTLITGVILYAIGTDQVKGFAITLILGVVLSMYTAIFCSRVVFDVAERRRWITKLSMLRILGATQIDFLGKRRVAAAFSVVLIVAGLVGVGLRSFGTGVRLLDIDFTGGVSVVTVFDSPQKIADIRKALDDLPDLAVSDVQLENQPRGKWFRINTSQEPEKDEATGKVTKSAIVIVEEQIREAARQMRQSAVEAVEQRLTKLLQAQPDAQKRKAAVEVVQTQLKRVLEDASNTQKRDFAIEAIKEQLAGVVQGESTIAEIEQELRDAFGKRLATNVMKVAGLGLVAEEPQTPSPKKDTPETDPPAAADPEGTDQTRSDLPDDSLLAMADPAEVEDPSSDEAATQPSSQTPPDKTPDEPAGETPDEPADETPEAPEDETPDEPADETPEAPEDEPAEGVEEPAAGAYSGWTQAQLTFSRQLGYGTLMELFAKEFGSEAGVPPLELTPLVEPTKPGDPAKPDPDFVVGDNTAYKMWGVKVKLPPQQAQSHLESVKATLADTPFFPASNTIGSTVASNTQLMAIYALAASLLFIVAYIWIRFQRVVFGLAAVVALVHDVLVTLGVIALSAFLAPYFGFLLIDSFKIGLPVLAAFLTIIGYSLNDTIVVFDRIREVRGKSPRLTEEMVNTSINQTLARTLLTSLTTLIVVLILYVFGGQVIRAFAFSLLIGVAIGTYSSVFVASPALLWMIRSSEAK